jgi:hypothetical protein
MNAFSRVFDPLDLAIIDRVEALRKRVISSSLFLSSSVSFRPGATAELGDMGLQELSASSSS